MYRDQTETLGLNRDTCLLEHRFVFTHHINRKILSYFVSDFVENKNDENRLIQFQWLNSELFFRRKNSNDEKIFMKIKIERDFENGIYQVKELVQDKYDDSRSLSI